MAGSRAGLKKVTKVVRGKKGSVKRTYWVKAQQAAKGVGGFLNRHKGKIAAGVALAAGAALAHRHRGAIKGAYHGAKIANTAAGGVSRGMSAVTGKGLGLRNRLKAITTGARAGAAVGGMADSGRRAVSSGRSMLDKVRSIPSAARGAVAGAKFGGRAAVGAGRSGVAALGAAGRATVGATKLASRLGAGTAGRVARAGLGAMGAIGRGTVGAVKGIARATPTLAKTGAMIGYHGNRARLAAGRAFGRKSS